MENAYDFDSIQFTLIHFQNEIFVITLYHFDCCFWLSWFQLFPSWTKNWSNAYVERKWSFFVVKFLLLLLLHELNSNTKTLFVEHVYPLSSNVYVTFRFSILESIKY